MTPFSFQLHAAKFGARAGEMHTAHGVIKTPVFMPVGTQASVKALDGADLRTAQAEIILANAYHLYLRPGLEVLQQQGGLHAFMNWSGPILTDSGGFQVFSLSHASTITPDGVVFKSHLDGSKHLFTPEKSLEVQRIIGADIIMAFDECTPDQADASYAKQALDRTHAWAKRCSQDWLEHEKMSAYGTYQALFGIIQGGLHQDLRRASAQAITELDFDGLAVGGETIGFNMAGTVQVMEWIEAMLPQDKPRYAMGLGRDPQDVITAVQAGFDMFDCVAPTRMARNGSVYMGELRATSSGFAFESPYSHGRLRIGRQEFARDQAVIQPGCDCFTCQQGYSRSYLHHLYKVAELSYYRLASIHNVRFMIRLVEQLRSEIMAQKSV